MTITVTVTEKKTVTYNPENNDLKREKGCITEHKRREKNVRKQKGGCAQDGKRMYISCNRREKMGRKTKKGSETLLPSSCFRTS